MADLPNTLDGLQIPVKVLQRRVHATDHDVVPQVLVQWSNLPRSLATWEDTEALRQRFPRAPAWGQAGLRWGGDVSIARGEEHDLDTCRADNAGPECIAVASNQSVPELRRSDRARRANVRFGGHEWA